VIVVLEGMPGSGKTTIGELLSNKYSFGLVPQIISSCKNKIEVDNKYCQNPFFRSDELKCSLAKDLEKTHGKVVMDRNYISTLAYNYAVNDKKHHSSFALASHWYLDKINSKLIYPTMYIYLKTPIKYCFSRKDRQLDTKSPWTDPSCLKKMSYFYENIFPLMETNIPKVIISTDDTVENVIDKILKYVQYSIF